MLGNCFPAWFIFLFDWNEVSQSNAGIAAAVQLDLVPSNYFVVAWTGYCSSLSGGRFALPW